MSNKNALSQLDEIIEYAKKHKLDPDPEAYEQIIFQLEDLEQILEEN